MLTYAIIPAAGRGVRLGMDKPKQFLELQEKPLLLHTLETIAQASFLTGIVLAVPEDFRSQAQTLVTQHLRHGLTVIVVAGGKERQDSVWNALQVIPGECSMVLIHDGVRPLVSVTLLNDTWKAAQRTGAAIAAIPATDTVKRVRDGLVNETLSREEIWLVQTPQVFRRDLLRRAYEESRRCGWSATDDASLLERIGVTVSVVAGDRTNLKITTPEDLEWLRWYLDTHGSAGDFGDRHGRPPCA
ncbi:MAG TPA: 2-C-methyl-D-erythritol 4-phosphate cytidylyltransferase [Syntrophobacteraceae bacterium]|nr:2-C-methyl-D-erythritol 4-phosphate cytidylyltransferase [Syntrophobacteraceae bacterium]